jgi:hypothetical protein
LLPASNNDCDEHYDVSFFYLSRDLSIQKGGGGEEAWCRFMTAYKILAEKGTGKYLPRRPRGKVE